MGSSSLVTCLRGLDNTTQQAHATGALVVQWWTANDWNDFIDSFLEGHVQQGGHQSLLDINNHTWLSQTPATNPVNHLDVANAASGSPVVLSAQGSDSNIDIDITPKGTGQVTTPNGTFPTIGLVNPYKFSAYNTTGQSVPITAWSKIVFQGKYFDTGSNFDTVTNYRFTAPIDGFYQFDALVSLLVVGGVFMSVALYKNGVEFVRGNWAQNATGANEHIAAGVSRLLELNATDYIEVFAFDNQAGTAAVDPQLTQFSGFLVSAK